MQRCWDGDPLLRPKASEVLEALPTSLVSFILAYIHRFNCILLRSGPPAWKWMTGFLLQWVMVFLSNVRHWAWVGVAGHSS